MSDRAPAGAASGPRHRFEALDSLRGICACMVVLYHLRATGAAAIGFIPHAFLFVDFFFVLSGFVIAASYGAKLQSGFSIARFMGLRLGRVYPLHLLMLLLFFAFQLMVVLSGPGVATHAPFQGVYTIRALIASLFLVQPFVGPDQPVWNGPSWSIAVEVWTYLIFAFVFRWAGRWLPVICIAITAGSMIYITHVTDRYLELFHDGALARCLFGFSLGVFGYWLHRRIAAIVPRGRFAGMALEVLAVVLALVIVMHSGPTPLSLAAPPAFLIVVLVFAREAGSLSSLLRLKPFLTVGMLSYSIYMIHFFLMYRFINIFAVLQRHLPGSPTLVTAVDGGHLSNAPLLGAVLRAVVLAGVIACAWASYRLVELPGMRWTRQRLLGEHPRPAIAAAEREAPTF